MESFGTRNKTCSHTIIFNFCFLTEDVVLRCRKVWYGPFSGDATPCNMGVICMGCYFENTVYTYSIFDILRKCTFFIYPVSLQLNTTAVLHPAPLEKNLKVHLRDYFPLYVEYFWGLLMITHFDHTLYNTIGNWQLFNGLKGLLPWSFQICNNWSNSTK